MYGYERNRCVEKSMQEGVHGEQFKMYGVGFFVCLDGL